MNCIPYIVVLVLLSCPISFLFFPAIIFCFFSSSFSFSALIFAVTGWNQRDCCDCKLSPPMLVGEADSWSTADSCASSPELAPILPSMAVRSPKSEAARGARLRLPISPTILPVAVGAVAPKPLPSLY